MAGRCVRYGGGGRFSSGAIAAVFPGSRARLGEVGGRGWREAGRELQHTNTLDLQLTDSYSSQAQCTSMHAIRTRRRAVDLVAVVGAAILLAGQRHRRQRRAAVRSRCDTSTAGDSIGAV
jgi:hypothetical protein